MKRCWIFLLWAAAATAASLPEEIERLLASSPVARTAFWGIKIVEIAHDLFAEDQLGLCILGPVDESSIEWNRDAA